MLKVLVFLLEILLFTHRHPSRYIVEVRIRVLVAPHVALAFPTMKEINCSSLLRHMDTLVIVLLSEQRPSTNHTYTLTHRTSETVGIFLNVYQKYLRATIQLLYRNGKHRVIQKIRRVIKSI